MIKRRQRREDIARRETNGSDVAGNKGTTQSVQFSRTKYKEESFADHLTESRAHKQPLLWSSAIFYGKHFSFFAPDEK